MCSVIWWDSRILPFLLKLLDNFTLTRTRALYIYKEKWSWLSHLLQLAVGLIYIAWIVGRKLKVEI